MDPGRQKPNILIVDDVPDNLHMLMDTLGDGYRYIPAKDGESALRKAEKNSDLDLVLLDIMMSGIDGYEVLRRLKANPDLQKIPVIFITATSESSDEAKGFRLGAVDYITKPFIPEVVQARVSTHVELKRKTDLLEKLATTDGLTGIYNRRKIDEILESEYRRAMRSGVYLSMAIIDIDHFKAYNDHYGHAGGDACLITVTGIIRDSLKRTSDAFGRYGGEEFVVIMPDTDESGASCLAREFTHMVAERGLPHKGSPTEAYVTISVGVATTIPENEGRSDREFLDIADKMLYEAKSNGRNRVRSARLYPDGRIDNVELPR